MNVDTVNSILGEAIMVILIVSLPSVGLGLLVGLVIAVIQAVTQVQEQTLTFVPKMIVVFLVIAVTFPWTARVLIEMSVNIWKNIPQYSK